MAQVEPVATQENRVCQVAAQQQPVATYEKKSLGSQPTYFGGWQTEELRNAWPVFDQRTKQFTPMSKSRVCHAWTPWLEKAIRLWRTDKNKFLAMLIEADANLIFDDEIELRVKRLNGTADRNCKR